CSSHVCPAASHLRSLSFFFLLIPRPPLSPLFPYTTLFRSQVAPAVRDRTAALVGQVDLGRALLHGMLGFLLFAGSLHIDLNDLRSEEHTSELQSLTNLVCRLLLEKKKKTEIAMQPEQYTHT